MTFKKSLVTLVFCAFSGMAVAAAPVGGGGEVGKAAGAAPAPMSASMQEMVGKTCPEYSSALGDDGRELVCVKGAWQAASSGQAKTAQAKRRTARVCRFRCSVSHGIEVCRGNGPQCNGVSPW